MSAPHPIGVLLAASLCVASLLWWLCSGITGGGE
jgi:hypothetical protein